LPGPSANSGNLQSTLRLDYFDNPSAKFVASPAFLKMSAGVSLTTTLQRPNNRAIRLVGCAHCPQTGFWEACQIGTDKSACRNRSQKLLDVTSSIKRQFRPASAV
jgi:hypothetical protein